MGNNITIHAALRLQSVNVLCTLSNLVYPGLSNRRLPQAGLTKVSLTEVGWISEAGFTESGFHQLNVKLCGRAFVLILLFVVAFDVFFLLLLSSELSIEVNFTNSYQFIE